MLQLRMLLPLLELLLLHELRQLLNLVLLQSDLQKLRACPPSWDCPPSRDCSPTRDHPQPCCRDWRDGGGNRGK